MWLCRCDCGVEKKVRSDHLIHSRVVSCGCFAREKAIEDAKKGRGAVKRTHGRSSDPVYRVYRAVLQRCGDPNNVNYHNYGGRGIKVCKRWQGKGGFERFIEDMGDPPPGTTIERVNNNGDYKPSNCIWADQKAQTRNRRNNRLVTFQGKTQLLVEWAEELGVDYKQLHKRIVTRGWDIERAMTQPFRKSPKRNTK